MQCFGNFLTVDPLHKLHSPTKQYFFLFAIDISMVLGYIRCADSENGLIFAELALVFEIYPLHQFINNGKIYYG